MFKYIVKLNIIIPSALAFPGGASGKEPACQCRRYKRSWFNPWVGKIPLEKGKAIHSSILVWEIPWAEEPGGLQSMVPQRIGHNRATKQHKPQSIPHITTDTLGHAVAAAKSLLSCPTLSDPMDCSLPGSSVHGIF